LKKEQNSRNPNSGNDWYFENLLNFKLNDLRIGNYILAKSIFNVQQDVSKY